MTRKSEILVVDDDSDIRFTMRALLERNGYAVKTAKNGKEALSLLESWIPDLIILDLVMTTDIEGFDVACMLRDDPKFANVPIIMVTCFLEKVRSEGPQRFQKILGEEWPADWLFEKPVDSKKLLDKIRGILGGA
jgi:DNA-binding response OmpR family regulator